MKLAVFVPVYNEQSIVEQNIRRIDESLQKLQIDFTLHVVDDKSTDSTPQVLDRMAGSMKGIVVHHCKNGPSRRENLAQAMLAAEEPYVMFMDLDLATDLDHLGQMVDYLRQGNAVVTGSRYARHSRVRRGRERLVISRLYNMFMRIYFGSRIHDHQCGFKGFEKQAFEKIMRIVGYDQRFVRGWFWDAEVLIVAQKLGYPVREFGVRWREGRKSSFSIKNEIRMIPYVLRLRSKFSRITAS